MKLKRVSAQYFLHFGEWNDIYFDDQKIVSIIGEWANEPKRSNRSGKSSFVEIIIYVIYGKTRAKKEIDLINRNFNEDMICELEFEINNETIIIRRGRTVDNSMILDLTGFEGADKKIVQDEINKLVGMTYEDFIMTSFFLQGDIHTFMEAGSSGQKQIISRWIEKEYWKSYERTAKDKQVEIQKQIDKLELVASDKPDLSEDTQIRHNINLLDNQKEATETVLLALNNSLEAINDEIKKADNIVQIKANKALVNKEINSLRDDIESIVLELVDIEGLEDKAIENQKRISLFETYTADYAKWSSSTIELQNDLRKKDREINKVQTEIETMRKQFKEIKQFGGICPVMNKSCSALPAIENAQSEIENGGKEKAILLKQLKEELKGIEVNLKASKELEKASNEVLTEIKQLMKEPAIEQVNAMRNNAQSRMNKKNELLNSKLEQLGGLEEQLLQLENIDLKKLKDEQSEIKGEIVDNKRQLNDIINNIATLNANLETNKSKRIKAIQANKQIEQLTETLNKYKFIAFMFSKNGIPSNQIETTFNEIEDEANIILEKVSPDISIEFLPDREMNTWEENCLVCLHPFPKGYRKIECPECSNERQKKRKDDLSINIKTQGKELDFNLESGGGKVLISLAIRLAFVRLLQRRIGANIKLIVFDEIFGMLDETNRNSVFRLLAETLIDDFGFEQILAISHEPEIRDSMPNTIKVTKYDEYSVFSWE